jgi:hypothetical protein
VVGLEAQSVLVPIQGTHTLPLQLSIVSISLIVEALPSLQARVVVGPVEQFWTIPAHGTHIFPLQSKMVCTSLIVHGLPSSQFTTDFVPLLQSVSVPAHGTQTMLLSQVSTVCMSLIVQELLSLQGNVTVLVHVGIGVPAQGTQILPSLFRMVSMSFVVHGLLSLQG